MKLRFIGITLLSGLLFIACKNEGDASKEEVEQVVETSPYFNWKGATVYFMLTDRFNNGDSSNDLNYDRTQETGMLRGFMGGDVKGITQKINEGYFDDLGVNVLWMTPLMEQIHGGTDEGTGFTYSFHGYWIRDWTAIDPNFGTMEDVKEMVDAAHGRGIRVLFDAVANHIGPVTPADPLWPDTWVRTEPVCKFESYETVVECALVKNLPDIKTESNDAVELPPQLVEKWKAEGRYDQELAELDMFFEKTGYPRAPRFYILKWLSDYVRDFGIDGFRVDTARHVEDYVWQEFRKVCEDAFSDYKLANPEKVLDNSEFYLVGEIYDYTIQQGIDYDFGDKKVDYYKDALSALINFDLKASQDRSYENVYRAYDSILNTSLKEYATMSYMSSHDDVKSYDMAREKPLETGTRLLLAPGAAQIYYGDEVARPLQIEDTKGDATLRSFMNWDAIASDDTAKTIMEHWRKLGQFRAKHFAIGAGSHKMISDEPYTFARTLTDGEYNDKVIVILGANESQKQFVIDGIFEEGTKLRDAYSNEITEVKNHTIEVKSHMGIILLEEMK